MLATHKSEHQDVIRIITYSDKSFDDAVKNGIAELVNGPHHKNLHFTNFEVVQLQGSIKYPSANTCQVDIFQVVMDVAGTHKHD